MMTKTNKQIGELLVEAGLVTPFQLDHGLETQRSRGGRLVRVLMDMGYFTPQEFQQAMARDLHFASIDLENYFVSPEVTKLIPLEFARDNDLLAIDRFRSHVSLLMACPMDTKALRDAEELLDAKVNPFMCGFDQMDAAIERYYGVREMTFADLRIRFSTGDKKRICSHQCA